jgi:hypothetical protein
VLLGVLFLMVMVLMVLAIAAPKVAADIERDREVELMHRGKQYQRAIQLYYRKFNAYPPNMDALEKTNEIRFLRKRYKDPITGKDEWHLIHFGEAKTPTAMGFFGQPIGGGMGSQTLGGIGPGGVGQTIGSPIGGSTFGNSSSIGSSTADPNSGTTGSGTTGSSGSSTNQTGTTTTDPNSTTGASGTTSGTSSGSSNGTTSGTTGGSSTSAFGNSSTSSSGQGQTFGGGGIIGVESTSPKVAILEYKKKKHFNEWEFVYDPAMERLTISSNIGTVGQGTNGSGNTTQPVVNSPSLGNQPPVDGTMPQPQPQPTPQPQQ